MLLTTLFYHIARHHIVKAEGELEEKDEFFNTASSTDANIVVSRYRPERSMGQNHSCEVR